MDLDIGAISASVFTNEIDKIPEPYREKLLKMIDDTQTKMKANNYEGDAGAGLLKMTVDDRGAIKKLNIDKMLFEQVNSQAELDILTTDLAITAHKKAIETIKSAMKKEIELLYEKIQVLANQIIESK